MAQETDPPELRQNLVTALARKFAASHGLSLRETEVLMLAAQGLHRKECAFRLGCSTTTVDTYWHRVFKKTGWRYQAEALAALLAFALDQVERRPRTGSRDLHVGRLRNDC
jgi:DNA-binding CsgD family transcriptional regulator